MEVCWASRKSPYDTLRQTLNQKDSAGQCLHTLEAGQGTEKRISISRYVSPAETGRMREP